MSDYRSAVHDTLCKHVLICDKSIVVDFLRSKGSYLSDHNGRKYLDCFTQYASQPLGWNHPKLVDAMSNILPSILAHKIANSDMYSMSYAAFVEEFAKFTPDFPHHFYISGGTLGVENALKAAFDWKCKKSGFSDEQANSLDVVHFRQAFHGRSGYTLSLTNTTKDKTEFFPKFNWTRVPNPKLTFPVNEQEAERAEMSSLAKIEEALATGNVAAIIVEPIQGEGGDNQFRPQFFKALRWLATMNEAMLIFDEVQTGLGMTGKVWCYQHYGVVPDMICFGKKVQVCGFCSTNRIDEVPNNVFKVPSRINSTWGGNIVDMVRSTAIMKIIREDNLVENARFVGNYFLSELQKLKGQITNIRGKGLMLAFDLPSGEERDKAIDKIKEKMLVIKCGEKSIRLRPALTFLKDDVDTAISILKASL